LASNEEELFCVTNPDEIFDLEMELLIQAILTRFQFDFHQYSRSSLRRRLQHAMSRFGESNLSALQDRILHEEDFFPKLLAYLTVNTTELFRDPESWASIINNVFPYLTTFPSLKIWIAGCSTGEEIITLSILLHEAGLKKYVIYATDINPMNLEIAQRGIYPNSVIPKAQANYKLAGGKKTLSEYFEGAYDAVKFSPDLFKNVVFADHSLATDSVFSEMHLISCRNVLIYFERTLQDRVFNLFNDSLVRGGFLTIGAKETLSFSTVAEKFKIIDFGHRIYQKI
jgi:chemotaxis protein methyltransferase CheR